MLKYSFSLLAFSVVFATATADAQMIPPNAQPGAIMQHNMQQLDFQRRDPWLKQPMTPQDTEAPSYLTPDIQYNEREIEGEIDLRPRKPE